jgi:SpoVK/Ycf46/Vps4 family AAA+-type ATPase
MEEFEGIFLCATNFADNLDPAAMRRFALKVRFDPLKRDQARALFADALQELGIEVMDELEQQRTWREIDALSTLTAGDFAAAKKAVDLDAFERSARGLADALRAELAARPEACRRSIGFAA